MTATPERTDGFNVFELFDYNVPYEIRLNHALEEDMLCPFHYYGVADVTFADGTTTTTDADLKVLISPERVDHLIHALEIYGQAGVAPRGPDLLQPQGRGACARRSAQRAGRCGAGRLRTVALTGDGLGRAPRAAGRATRARASSTTSSRSTSSTKASTSPRVNQVIMLRQTQSAIVFVQQLGRGLRKADGQGVPGRHRLHRQLHQQLPDPDRAVRRRVAQQGVAAQEPDRSRGGRRASGACRACASTGLARTGARSIVETTLDSMQPVEGRDSADA